MRGLRILCPELPQVTEQEYCHMGTLPSVICGHSDIFCSPALLVAAVSGHVAWQKHTQRKSERLQLLQDAAPSDDEDEGDVVHNAGMLDGPQKNYYLNTVFDAAFSRLGRVCARFPAITITISVVLVGLLSLGWINFAVETDPVRLWVSPSSAAAEESLFDSKFGPFIALSRLSWSMTLVQLDPVQC
jgi:Niemann-Pick C1 protein